MAALIKRLRASAEGAELIEMAIVTPLLLLLILGIVDFGFLFQRYVVLTNAAAEGARVASLPGYTPADVTARVAAYAANGGINPADGPVNTVTVAVALPGPGGAGAWPGSQVTVTHIYNLQYLGAVAALVGGNNITLTSRATVRNQVAAAAP
jgi:Flp pilus assembly protein TadG